MSTRAVRRLREARDAMVSARQADAQAAVSAEASDRSGDEQPRRRANPFAILADDERTAAAAEESAATTEDLTAAQEQRAAAATRDDPANAPVGMCDDGTARDGAADTAARKKKKKKKKQQRRSPGDDEPEESGEDLDELLRGFRLADRMEGRGRSSELAVAAPRGDQELLHVTARLLDVDVELRKLFGNVVSAERRLRSAGVRKSHGNSHLVTGRQFTLVHPKEHWPRMKLQGLGMDLLGRTDDGNALFKLTHGKTYQSVQREFYICVRSYDPANLAELLRLAPYHIDTNLQMSEILRHRGEHSQAAEMIERALHALDKALHPLFSVSAGTSRLPFTYAENRTFYLSVWRHMQNLFRRACWQTSFEFNKLLFCMDPVNDPYGALLVIDFCAIRSKQYAYLTELRDKWTDKAQLMVLPNIQYSAALAEWHMETNDKIGHEQSSQKLLKAIKTFPWVVPILLESLGQEIPTQFQPVVPPSLLQKIYATLYIHRSAELWSPVQVTEFLQNCLSKVDHIMNITQSEIVMVPQNVARHVILEDERTLVALLPPTLISHAYLSVDPVPPSDSISPYEDDELLVGAGASSNASLLERLQHVMADLMVHEDRQIDGEDQEEPNEQNDSTPDDTTGRDVEQADQSEGFLRRFTRYLGSWRS